MFAALVETQAVAAVQDPTAPFEFLSGWVYGVSLQKDEIRNAMIACAIPDDGLKHDVYAAMDALGRGDSKTANDKWNDATPLYKTALAKCGDDVTGPLEKWGDAINKMVTDKDWDKNSKKIYDDNKKEIDDDVALEIQWFDGAKFNAFNSGMYAGRVDKIFLDNSPAPTLIVHPFVGSFTN